METNQGMSCYYYINDGIFGNFMDRSLLGLTYKPRPILMKSANEVNSNIPETQDEVICTIYGMSGDSNDYVAHKAGGLPLMDIGDWLIFPNMGAYTLVFSTSFNGFEAPDFALGIILEDTWHQHFVPNGSTKQKFSIKLNRNSWSNLETLSLSPICKEAMAPKMIFQVNSSKQK